MKEIEKKEKMDVLKNQTSESSVNKNKISTMGHIYGMLLIILMLTFYFGLSGGNYFMFNEIMNNGAILIVKKIMLIVDYLKW